MSSSGHENQPRIRSASHWVVIKPLRDIKANRHGFARLLIGFKMVTISGAVKIPTRLKPRPTAKRIGRTPCFLTSGRTIAYRWVKDKIFRNMVIQTWITPSSYRILFGWVLRLNLLSQNNGIGCLSECSAVNRNKWSQTLWDQPGFLGFTASPKIVFFKSAGHKNRAGSDAKSLN